MPEETSKVPSEMGMRCERYLDGGAKSPQSGEFMLRPVHSVATAVTLNKRILPAVRATPVDWFLPNCTRNA